MNSFNTILELSTKLQLKSDGTKWTVEVSNPQIFESDRRLDFGKGFYLTSSYEQAKRWVANDKTMPVISLYFSGIYDIEETIKRLMPQKLCDQYTFRTEKAIKKLKFVEVK